MSAPDRPTREQAAHPGSRMVGESYKDHSARAFGMLRAAEVDLAEARAEVRALRAELDTRPRQCSCPDAEETYAQLEREHERVCSELDALRAALVARTPQPAEPTRHLVILSGLADEIDQHAAIAARPGQMGDLERIACAVRDVANELAPLPTVSDGEDETSRAVSRLMFDARPVDHAAEQVAVRTVDLARVLNEFIQYAAAGINKPRQEGP